MTALTNSLYPEEKSSSHIFITRVSFANWSWAPTLPQNWEGCYVSWLNFQEKFLSSVRTALGKQTGERLLKWFLAQWCRGKRLQAQVSGMLSEKGEVLCGSVGGEGGWRPGGVQKLLHIYTSWGKCQDLVGHFLRLVHFKCLRNYSYHPEGLLPPQVQSPNPWLLSPRRLLHLSFSNYPPVSLWLVELHPRSGLDPH